MLMALEATFLAASDADIGRYVGGVDVPDLDGAQYTTITPLEVAALWSILRGDGRDSVELVDQFESTAETDEKGPSVVRLPDDLVARLATLEGPARAQIAEAWASATSAELGWEPARLQSVLDDLIFLSQRANASGKHIYLWNSIAPDLEENRDAFLQHMLSVLGAQRSHPPLEKLAVARAGPDTIDRSKLYPYVVPAAYLRHAPSLEPDFCISLGHDVYVMPVIDYDGVCQSVTPDELRSVEMSASECHAIALENLSRLAKSRSAFLAHKYTGEYGHPFAVWQGHWLTASCIRLPHLYDWATKTLGADEFCVSIPHREAMIIFPMADRRFRDAMRALIYEKESDAPKQITFELFRLDVDGLAPFVE